MLKIERTVLPSPEQWDIIIKGMRNPLNSWAKSDSYKTHIEDAETLNTADYEFFLGDADHDLMMRLNKGGSTHAKYRRMIPVYVTVNAPLYWWKEMSTYSVGVVTNSCSTMHKIHAKEFTMDDFSHEHLLSEYNLQNYYDPAFDEEKSDIRPVEGFPEYDVSSTGTVYSWKSGERVPLKQRVDIDGYKTVGLYADGMCKRVKVHRLVANTFLERVSGKDCVNHKDGNKWNNSADNLEWCTRSENSLHASKNGLLVYGSKQRIGKAQNRRFTKEQIDTIKELYFADNLSQRELGRMFGCDHSVISEIVRNKIYKDVRVYPLEALEITVDELNRLRDAYLESGDKGYWYSMIQLLPTSYNQKRTVMLNYEVLCNIYHTRKDHKLDEWHTFCRWIESLPHSDLIIGE